MSIQWPAAGRQGSNCQKSGVSSRIHIKNGGFFKSYGVNNFGHSITNLQVK